MKKADNVQTKQDDMKNPGRKNNSNQKEQADKWNKVKSVNLKGKKVDADPDKESDKPVDILKESGN